MLAGGPDADHGQRPVPQCWQDRIAHHVEVVDQMALCRTGTIEKLVVEVAQRHPSRSSSAPLIA